MAIVAFWVAMNSALIMREARIDELSRQQAAVRTFLEGGLRRERWQGIFRTADNEFRKIGYTGYILEKEFEESRIVYRATIDTEIKDFIPQVSFLPESARDRNRLRLTGYVTYDEEQKPIELRIDLIVGIFEGSGFGAKQIFTLEGERDEASAGFRVALSRGEERLFEIPLPLEQMTLSNGLTPALTVGDFRVGETYRTKVLDPLSSLGLGSGDVEVKVVEERTEALSGIDMDILVLEIRWNETTVNAWATKDGEIVRQELGAPFHIVLKHQPDRETAVRGFER